MDDLETEVEVEYRAGDEHFSEFCLTQFYPHTRGELTEVGYRKRKVKIEKEILRRDFEEGTLLEEKPG